MHDALPFSYVIHTHPALVNGVTCARNGQETVGTLFGERALWIPLVDPGYVLAQRVAEELETHRSHTGTDPQVLFLQNHGLVVAGNDPNEMRRLHEHIAATIEARLTRRPDESAVSVDPEQVEALESRLADAFARLSGRGGGEARGASGTPAVSFSTNAEISRMVQSPEAFAPISGPYTPDHIVYAGHHPPLATAESPEDAVEEHLRVWGHLPRTIAVEGVGLFAVAGDTRAAERALALAADAVRIAVYAESFGGPRFMDPERVAFIRNWEVERYREKVGSDG
jgi:rhamnose utilization protein RhaD (predicted bifunctional aldolase and dehydrogenase)